MLPGITRKPKERTSCNGSPVEAYGSACREATQVDVVKEVLRILTEEVENERFS